MFIFSVVVVVNLSCCSGFSVISEAIKTKNENGRLASSILANGDAISDELVLNMINDKVKSAEVAHQGIP